MPFTPHIGIRGWVVNRKTKDKDIGLGIGERSQSVIFFLTSCVSQVQADDLDIHRYLGTIIVKDSRDIFFRKGICCITDEEAGLTYSPISHNHTFDHLHSSLWSPWTPR